MKRAGAAADEAKVQARPFRPEKSLVLRFPILPT